jgi:PAS domain S-box-containing protein
MWIFIKPSKRMFLDWRGYVIGISLVALATLLKYFAQPNFLTRPNSLLYILAIVITAVYFGFGPAIIASVLSVIIYDYLYVSSPSAFSVPEMTEIVTLLIFLLVGIIVSFLTASLHNKTEEAVRESTLRKKHEEDLIIYRDNLEELVNQRTAELEKSRDELETKVKERTSRLAESEEKYRLLVENANEAVIVFQENREKFFNGKAIELSGYSGQELANKSILEFIHPDDRNLVMDRYAKRLDGLDVPSPYEFRMIHKDGRTMWVDLNAVLITWEGRPAILGIMTDITERKNMEQTLKDYAQRITQIQEEERKRIAYELHDDTAQYLSILKLQLESLVESQKITDPEIKLKLQYLAKDANRAFNDVRRYSHELRPGVLEHLGLQAALEQIADDINKLNDIPVHVTTEGEETILSEAVKLGFFRIAQEAVNNTRKHAKASKVHINLKFSPDRLQMVISDDGVGFNVQEGKTQLGLKGNLGLTSMQERAKLIGADLKITSQPGRGTQVKVEVGL